MSLLRFVFALASVGAVMPSSLQPQSPGTSISGIVRTENGAPVAAAIVTSGGRTVVADSLGRFALAGLSGDSARLVVRRVGLGSADTTVALRPNARVRVDVTLGDSDRVAQLRRAEAADAMNGRVDSSALGILRPSRAAAPPLTFTDFGPRFLAAALAESRLDDNVVVSPTSAGLALGLALQGARNGTESALAALLGTTTLDRTALVQRGASFLAATTDRSDVQLEIANAIWVDSAALLTSGFIASATAWNAAPATLRLTAPATVDVMNRWADSATHGKITRIFDDPVPDASAVVIASAVYFKGKWLEPFEKSATIPREFTLASGAKVQVPSMTRTGHLGYRRDSGFQLVRLPYRGGRAAMYVVLPDSGVATDALMRRFSVGARPASLAQRDMQLVHLELPRLHVEQTLDLMPLIARLGAGIALDCPAAEFGDMAISRASGAPLTLCILKAVQKIHLDMDEEGTEAAAVTGVVTGPTSMPRIIEVKVNRPFLIILRDEVTGADLFMGRIARP